eukprot:m.7100 g.7100  ORF g.7100 m.7100 type:complete len:197 (+) comp6492_c0_seq2:435-1025(+)
MCWSFGGFCISVSLSLALDQDVTLHLSSPLSTDREMGWYFCNNARHYKAFEPVAKYHGLDESVAFIKKVVAEKGPFDGILAFSQGASFLGFLCTMRDEIPFRFAVFISGFEFTEEAGKARIAAHTPLTLPSLHIFGETDNVIPKDDCEKFAKSFANPTIVRHPGGHFVPWPASGSPGRQALHDFFQAQVEAKQTAK